MVRHAGRRFGANASAAVAAAAVAAILVEGYGPMPQARVPARPPAELTAPAPQLQLPTIVGLDGTVFSMQLCHCPSPTMAKDVPENANEPVKR